MTEGPIWQLSVLGPVRFQAEGGPPLQLLKRQQALLLMLALAGRQSRARIAQWLWPTLDEAAGRRNLRRELVRLRERGGAAEIVKSEGDLLLLAEAVEVDLARAEAALQAGDAEAALSSWAPLADGLGLEESPEFEGWLAGERERVAQWQARALAASAARREAAGDLAGALERVQALLEAQPLLEARHADAMRLLAALGQREAALLQYERCRRLLASELGLEPMAATQALARQLGGAPPAETAAAPSDVAAAPQPALPAQLPFVGRQAEVAMLEPWWSRGGAATLEGEGGIGKTRLATEFAAAHGPYALVACRADDRALPYAAFGRALVALFGDDPLAARLPPAVQEVLAPLWPQRGAGPRPAVDTSRLADAARQAWRAAAEDFDAVIVDDFHLADDASQALLAGAAAEAGAGRLLCLLRPGELQAAGEAALRALALGGAPRIALPPLADDAVLALVQHLSGAASPTRFAHRLEQATAGNPFFLSETLRHLAESGLIQADAQGRWRTPFDAATQDYRELPVPPTVGDAVRDRLRRLPEAAVRVVEAASLWQGALDLRALAQACALGEAEVLDALEAAMQARLVRDDERGGYALAHDLVAQSVSEALGAQRRRLLHRRLALAAQAGGAEPAIIARHLEAAGDLRAAVEHRIEAGKRAVRLQALAVAREHFERADALGAEPKHQVRVLAQLGSLNWLAGDGAAVELLIQRLDALRAEAADAAVALDAAAEAASLVRLRARDDEALARAHAVLAAAPGGLVRARALEVVASSAARLGRYDEAAAAAEQALAEPTLTSNARLMLLGGQCVNLIVQRRNARALEMGRRFLAAAQAMAEKRFVAKALVLTGIAAAGCGQVGPAREHLARAADMAHELGHVEMEREALFNAIDLEWRLGEAARVHALAERGWALEAGFGRPLKELLFMMARAAAAELAGELGLAWSRAEAVMARALQAPEDQDLWTTPLARMLPLALDLGQAATARRWVDALAADGQEVLGEDGRYVGLALAALALAEGQTDRAAAWQAKLPQPAADDDPDGVHAWRWLAARVALAHGDARAALAGLQDLQAPALDVALLARRLACRLDARCAAGDATQALAEGRAAWAARAWPPLPALELLRALVRGAAAAGEADPPEAGLLAAAVERLATTFDGQPEARSAFLRHWTGAAQRACNAAG